MAGAWDCYRAVLRMTVHVRRRERLADRLRANLWLLRAAETSRDLGGGSQDHDPPASTRPGGGVECRPRPEWDAFTLKMSIWTSCDFWTRPVDPPPEQIEEEWTYRLGDMQLPVDLSAAALPGRSAASREPERSRRVIRLLFANWLAHVEHRRQQRQPAVASALPHRKADERRVAVSRQP